jgi:hypothetical protein
VKHVLHGSEHEIVVRWRLTEAVSGLHLVAHVDGSDCSPQLVARITNNGLELVRLSPEADWLARDSDGAIVAKRSSV